MLRIRRTDTVFLVEATSILSRITHHLHFVQTVLAGRLPNYDTRRCRWAASVEVCLDVRISAKVGYKTGENAVILSRR